jgi:uncharacterized protein YihD (DUF1040 family)
MATYPITISGATLATMYDNDMGIYLTPGSTEPYWAAAPSWQNDVALGSAIDVLDALSDIEGYEVDIDDLREDDTIFTVELTDEPLHDEDDPIFYDDRIEFSDWPF